MYIAKKLSKNKALEIESHTWPKVESCLSFFIEYRTKGDHAGFNFNFEIGRWYFGFQIYDIRHWDYDNNCWKRYE